MTSLAGAHVSGREQGGIAAAVLTVAVVVLFFASLAIGRSGLGVLSLLSRAAGEDAETIALILREIRLPRAILGVLVGGALGLAGAALQGLLRNPLAEPGLIGASGAAALGAVAALYFGLSTLFPLALLPRFGPGQAVGFGIGGDLAVVLDQRRGGFEAR